MKRGSNCHPKRYPKRINLIYATLAGVEMGKPVGVRGSRRLFALMQRIANVTGRETRLLSVPGEFAVAAAWPLSAAKPRRGTSLTP